MGTVRMSHRISNAAGAVELQANAELCVANRVGP